MKIIVGWALRWLLGWADIVDGACWVVTLGAWRPDASLYAESAWLDWVEGRKSENAWLARDSTKAESQLLREKRRPTPAPVNAQAIHRIVHTAPGFACQAFKPYTEERAVSIMAVAAGYAMVRQKGAIPYVAPVKELYPQNAEREVRT